MAQQRGRVFVGRFNLPFVKTWASGDDRERRERIRERAAAELPAEIPALGGWALRIHVRKGPPHVGDLDNVAKLIADSFSQTMISEDRSEYERVVLYPDDSIEHLAELHLTGECSASVDDDQTTVEIYGWGEMEIAQPPAPPTVAASPGKGSPGNIRLQREYEDAMERFAPAVRSIREMGRNISSPLLMDLDAHGYLAAPRKLMIVGQQTFGWGEASTYSTSIARAVAKMVLGYREFEQGTGYYNSPFWRSARLLREGIVGGESRTDFLWTNVLKVDENSGEPARDVTEALFAHFNVLPAELEVAAPDVVVFLSGPNYDEYIRRQLRGVTFEPIEGVPVKKLARVRHERLPKPSYRTYHPNYLQRSGQLALLERVTALAR